MKKIAVRRNKDGKIVCTAEMTREEWVAMGLKKNWFEGASPAGLLVPGGRVNITHMEGGGTYVIERVNANGTVDVRDEMNRPMQVRRERIYPVS
jgi:uncharacterized protein YjhX (UPF0386 family)